MKGSSNMYNKEQVYSISNSHMEVALNKFSKAEYNKILSATTDLRDRQEKA